MKRSVSQLLVVFLLCLAAPAAFAQATRTWISGVGDDANPCSRTAPCKTFAGAISKTAPYGEIDALDPGGFGAITITKSITLDGGGGQVASILVAGTNGIVVAAAATDTVILRNLSINGLAGSNAGLNGIRYIGGGQLVIDNCNIMGFGQSAIDMAVTTTGSGNLVVRNTTITGGIGSIPSVVGNGITMEASPTPQFLSISHSSIRSVVNGVNIPTGGTADISNSTINGATGAGLLANGGVVNAESNMLSNNSGTAVLPTAGVVRLSNNDLFNNGLGVGTTGTGTVASAGNNRKAGNGTGSTTATITTF